MPRCTNCQEKWKIGEIFALGFSKNGRACPYCGTMQYFSAETKRYFTLGYLSLLFIPVLIFFIRLSNRDEPM